MRMRLRQLIVRSVILALGFSIPAGAQAKKDSAPEPDPKTMRFIQRASSWYPDSVYRLVENVRHETSSGSYRFVTIERTCASKLLSGVW